MSFVKISLPRTQSPVKLTVNKTNIRRLYLKIIELLIKHDFDIHLLTQGPTGSIKTSGFTLGFSHFPRDLANVNESKIIFIASLY